VLSVDPRSDESWKSLTQQIRTDEVHAKDRLNHTIETPGINAIVLSVVITIISSLYTRQ